jgi:HAD superfamily hydrolase (TIGR01509 family)
LISSLRAVIWDLDGVIADTGAEHLLAFQEVLPAYGIAFTPEIFTEVFGMGNRETLAYLTGGSMDEDLINRIIEEKETRYRSLVRGRVQLLPGVKGWLDAFRQARIRQAVATSAPQANVDVVLNELGIAGCFDVILSAPSNGLPGKPAPDVFLLAAERLGVPAWDCIVLEDSEPGIRAARAAGMTPILVPDLKPPSPEIAALTHRVLPSLDAVREYLAALLEEEPSYADHRPATG